MKYDCVYISRGTLLPAGTRPGAADQKREPRDSTRGGRTCPSPSPIACAYRCCPGHRRGHREDDPVRKAHLQRLFVSSHRSSTNTQTSFARLHAPVAPVHPACATWPTSLAMHPKASATSQTPSATLHSPFVIGATGHCQRTNSLCRPVFPVDCAFPSHCGVDRVVLEPHWLSGTLPPAEVWFANRVESSRTPSRR